MANSARERSTCAAGGLSERLRRVSSWRSSAVSGRRGSCWWRDMGHLGARGSPHHDTRSHDNRPTSHREFAMAAGGMSADAFTAFLTTVFERLAAHTRDGAIHFICMDWRHLAEILVAGGAVYAELKNLIVWVKDKGGMGSFYRSRHELVFAFKHGTAPHLNAFELGQNGRYRTNVWNYRGITSLTREAREAAAMHPTVKPVAMVADALKDTSRPGGLVLDAFCGSGTILIAAQKTGRRARAIEIDPLYCDVALRRWQAFAKDDAILAETGETFDAVAARRRPETCKPAKARRLRAS